jgi:hypothetical protein
MKVNFWQVLGVVLVIIGVVLFARKKTGTTDTTQPAPTQQQSRPATTEPTTAPVTP